VRTPGGEQALAVISEAGLYVAVLGSQVEGARAFKRWVTHEVLPAIRRTGMYAVAETTEQIMARGLVAAQQMLETAQTQVAELTPRAEAWDRLASATGDYEVGDAAKILARAGIETGRGRLFGSLADLGWIYRSPNGSWKARQTCVDAGYLAEKPQSHYHPGNGDLVIDPPQVRVTVKGIEKLRQRLSKPLDLTA
jgi:phage antirepressor YoqD-like protein